MTIAIDHIQSWQHMPRLHRRPLTQNEHFWLEVIRLSSWDSDPAPTLGRVQQLRRIFEPAKRGSTR